MSGKKDSNVLGHEDRVAVFQEQAIRRAWHEGQWWFSVVDVVGVLSESAIPRRYWSDLKRKMAQEAGSEQPYEKIVRLKLTAPDGKQRDTDCADTETLFRISVTPADHKKLKGLEKARAANLRPHDRPGTDLHQVG